MIAAQYLPEGFEIRDNQDFTHTLLFRDTPVTMEWIKALPVRRSNWSVDHNSERELFREVAVINTGRSHTWFLTSEAPSGVEVLGDHHWYTHGVTRPVTAVAGTEILVLREGRFYIHAFLASRHDVLIIDGGGACEMDVIGVPDLYQPSAQTLATLSH